MITKTRRMALLSAIVALAGCGSKPTLTDGTQADFTLSIGSVLPAGITGIADSNGVRTIPVYPGAGNQTVIYAVTHAAPGEPVTLTTSGDLSGIGGRVTLGAHTVSTLSAMNLPTLAATVAQPPSIPANEYSVIAVQVDAGAPIGSSATLTITGSDKNGTTSTTVTVNVIQQPPPEPYR
jgi:hypothetical protein